MKLIDISGQRFGRLVVVKKSTLPRLWMCLCDCGGESLSTGANLRKGKTKSCGCLAKEWAAQMGANPEFIAKRKDASVTHGHKKGGCPSVEYRTWLGMKRRCYDPKCKDYPNWGGRGIRVCSRWLNSFENFLSDMGMRPEDKQSIDRLDSNGDYSPENCRWATFEEQGGENRRAMTPVCYAGVQYHSIKAACDALGIKYTTVWQRMQSGLTAQQALQSGSARMKSRRTPESYWRKELRKSV